MAGGTVLIADDDSAIRTVLNQAFARAGYAPRATGNAATLWRWVAQGEGDVVITDVVMPDENAFDLIPRIKKLRPDLPIIVMSAQNTLMTALTAAEKGAFEYLPKPFDLNQIVAIVGRALAEPGTAQGARVGRAADAEELPLIGRSPAMQEIYRVLARLTRTDLTVMITGESGTGKELVARVLHDYSKRRNGPFVAINMAAIPRELIESELFGHEKGAFTGAQARTEGRFQQAEGGTLFLDEIGDMPMEAQTRLLRVLQEGEYTTVGGRTPIKTDVRIIAATHRELKTQIQQGLFREDLYYRLNVVPLRLPPLRERLEDIGDLVRHFLRVRPPRPASAHKSIETAAIERLKHYHWPGNVRELENMVRRLGALHPEDTLTAEIVEAELAETAPPPTVESGKTPKELSEMVERYLAGHFAGYGRELPPPGLYDRVLQHVERPLLMAALAATRGNQIRAAALLGLNRNTLRKKIRDLDIQVFRTPRHSASEFAAANAATHRERCALATGRTCVMVTAGRGDCRPDLQRAPALALPARASILAQSVHPSLLQAASVSDTRGRVREQASRARQFACGALQPVGIANHGRPARDRVRAPCRQRRTARWCCWPARSWRSAAPRAASTSAARAPSKKAAARRRLHRQGQDAIEILAPAGIDAQRADPARHGQAPKRARSPAAGRRHAFAQISARKGEAASIVADPADPGEVGADVFAADLALRRAAAQLHLQEIPHARSRPRTAPRTSRPRRPRAGSSSSAPSPMRPPRRSSRRKALAEGVFLARDLVNEPANMLGPVEFADRMRELTAPASRSRCWTRTSSAR